MSEAPAAPSSAVKDRRSDAPDPVAKDRGGANASDAAPVTTSARQSGTAISTREQLGGVSNAAANDRRSGGNASGSAPVTTSAQQSSGTIVVRDHNPGGTVTSKGDHGSAANPIRDNRPGGNASGNAPANGSLAKGQRNDNAPGGRSGLIISAH